MARRNTREPLRHIAKTRQDRLPVEDRTRVKHAAGRTLLMQEAKPTGLGRDGGHPRQAPRRVVPGAIETLDPFTGEAVSSVKRDDANGLARR